MSTFLGIDLTSSEKRPSALVALGTRGRLWELGHDLCDAIVAAYTAYLHVQGQTESFGIPEEELIVVPRLDRAIGGAVYSYQEHPAALTRRA